MSNGRKICFFLLVLLNLGIVGCGASLLSPTAPPATPTGKFVFGVQTSELHGTSPVQPQGTPTLFPQPEDMPAKWLYISDPTYGISWKAPSNWYWIQESWPISMPGAVLLGAVASEKDAAHLLSSPQPVFPTGLMALTVYAMRAEAPLPDLHEAQPVTVSGQTAWVQEVEGSAAMPFTWRATLFIQGTSAYSYTLSFGCAPPTGADDAGKAKFQALCRQIWEHILEGVEISGKNPCILVPTPTPGPITWRRVHSDWYRYSFEVPSGWYEDPHSTPDRRLFSSTPLSSEHSPYCSPPNSWMKLDFGVFPLEYQPDLTGMSPVTIAGRPAWVSSGKGEESAPSIVQFSTYISGFQYWYHLRLACALDEFEAECPEVMKHILESFQIVP
jgi:hypothetical protein